MKCFVSGATGFIGRQLCHQLEVQGDTVVALSKSGAPLNSGAPTVGFDLAHKDPDANMLQGVEVGISPGGGRTSARARLCLPGLEP